jgi:hypothetical protein
VAEGHWSERKKIAALQSFLAEAAEEVAADFRRYYQLDLRDLWRRRGGRDRLTFNVVQLYIDRLPPESLTKTHERNKYSPEQLRQLGKQQQSDHGPWSQLELLVAHLIDVVEWLVHVTNGGKGTKPKPYPRPGVTGPGGRKRGRLLPWQMRKLAAVRVAPPPPPPPDPAPEAGPM